MSFFAYAHAHADYFKKHGQKVTYRRGQFLVNMADDSPWVFFLEEGTVKVLFSLSDGSERLIGYFVPGLTFAQSGSFYADSGGSVEYVAVNSVVAWRLPRDTFLEALKNSTPVTADYTDMLLRNQIFLIERIVYQGEQSTRRKLLRWLLFMAKYYSDGGKDRRDITIPLTQNDIANFLHVTRVSVSTALRVLSQQDLVATSRNCLTIKSITAIKRELGD